MRDLLTTLLAIGFLGVVSAATCDGRTKVGDRSSAGEPPLLFNLSLSPPLLGESVENHVFAVTGSVVAKNPTTLSFVVPETEGLTATLLGEHVRWSFRSPSGRVIIPGETKKRDDYEYEGGGGISVFHLNRPAKGTWTVLVRSTTPDSAAAYAIDVELDGHVPVVAHLETVIDGALPNTRNFATHGAVIYIRTFVADRGSPIAGVQWDVQVRTQADSSFMIPVYDDGKHADGAPADGISVGAFRAQAQDGGYTLRAACRGPDGAERIALFFVDISERAD
jgi:hypothetical protein